jgi:hypothetical protein
MEQDNATESLQFEANSEKVWHRESLLEAFASFALAGGVLLSPLPA